MTTTLHKTILAGLIGLISGIELANLINGGVDHVKIFPRENNQSIIRMYRPGPDEIFVGLENNTIYLPIRTYLSNIQDKAIRNLEQAEIEKTVDWYR